MNTQHTDALSIALDYYVTAAINYDLMNRDGCYVGSDDRDNCRDDVVQAIDALITARIRDLVKVG